MKNIFYRAAGILLSSSLVFTGLNFIGNSKAFAEENSTDSQNSVSEENKEAVYANVESIQIIDETNTSAKLEVKLDKNLEDTDMPLFVYEENNPNSIKEISEGEKNIQFEIEKESHVKNIYVTTGSSTSNTVIIDEMVEEIETFQLIVDNHILETDKNQPILSWDIQFLQSGQAIYLSKSNGEIFYSSTNRRTSDTKIPRFYTESEETYTAFIADYNYSLTNINQLKNITHKSNSVIVTREIWNIRASVDLSTYTTENSQVKISWESNEVLDGTDNNYRIYLVNLNSNKIIEKIYSRSLTDTISTKVEYYGKETKFALYVAKNENGITQISDLKDIQAISNSVSTKHKPFELEASINNSIFYTYDETPVISWSLNQQIGRGYALYLIDKETDRIVKEARINSNGEISIPRFYQEDTKNFKLYLTERDDSAEYFSELTNISTESQTFTVHRAKFTLHIESVPVSGLGEDAILWTANQPVTNSHTLYLIDLSNNYIIYRDNFHNDAQTYTDTIIHGRDENNDFFYLELPYHYKAVIADNNYDAKYYEDLTGIEIESNTVDKQAQKWHLGLNYSIVEDENNNYDTYRLKVRSNKSVYGTDYLVYVAEKSTGKIIKNNYTSNRNFEFDVRLPANKAEEYTAYIADRSTAKHVDELTNIIATSESVYPKYFPSSGDYNPQGGRFGGGFNPSSSDCQQQCYGDPINSYTGEYFESTIDLEINNPSPLSLTRSYSTSKKDELGAFGLGGTTNYNMQLAGEFDSLEDSDNIRFIQENGSIADFMKTSDGTFISAQDTETKLNKIDNEYVITRKSNEKFTFNNSGKLIKLSDLFNNSTSLVYTNGYVTKAVSDNGKYIQLNYNTDNLINSITDGRRTINYTYDAQKRLINVNSYKAVNSKKYSYDSQNRVSQIIQVNGGIYKNTYDSDNRVVKQIDPLNNETLFEYKKYYNSYETKTISSDKTIKVDEYSIYGKLVSETFNYGGKENIKYNYEYGFSGQVSKTISPTGIETKYMYDQNGNISTIIDALGRSTRFTYNDFNQVVEQINPYGKKTVNYYDDKGMLTSTKDANENITKYKTNGEGQLTEILQPEEINKNSPKSEKIIYDTNGFVSQNVSPEGGIQKITNNSLGLPVKFTDPYNNATLIAYNSQFNISKLTYPDGTFEEYKYDNASRLTKYIDILGNETSYTYDLMDNIVSSANPFGTTIYDYDSSQKLVKVTEPNSAETFYKYDSFGRLIETKNAEGNISTNEYSKNNNLISETDFKGNKTSHNYDKIGNRISTTDTRGKRTSYIYDKLDRLTEKILPNKYTETYNYDNINNLTNVTKAGIESTTYSYDGNNNLIRTQYSDQSFEEISYNANDVLITFKNRDNKITNYDYNFNNQIIGITRPDNSKESVKYNSMGKITQVSYDNWVSIDTEYEYNNSGQLTKSIKGNNETNYAYDNIGKLTSRGPLSQQVNYSYDNYGRLNGIDYPFGSTIQYFYNTLDTIDKVTLNNTDEIIKYNYDANGNIINEIYGNGVSQNNEYDSLNRLSNTKVKNSNEHFLYNRSLQYDETYLLEKSSTFLDDIQTENTVYSYSKLDKLLKSIDSINKKTSNYNINAFSNLIQSPTSDNTFTKNGQLINSQINDVNYSYSSDERGNRLTKDNNDNNSSVNYLWTNDNKLKNLTINNIDNSSTNIEYTYDASGLLKSRSKNSVETDEYVWDTLSTIPLLLEDGSNEYIYGNGSSPLAQIDKNSGNIKYLHGDERGSVVLATDDTGNSVLTREYDAYGNHSDNETSNASPSSFDTNFAYAGEYQDKDTGLYNLRARWYEPLTGSFISQDPALTVTGEGYSYASGNPLSFTDPLGLYSTSINPSDSAVGNVAAGFVDGLIGVPVVDKISNTIKPGSVDICGPVYKYSGYAGFAVGFIPPGGAVVRGSITTLKTTNNIHKVNKISKNTHRPEYIYKGYDDFLKTPTNRKVEKIYNSKELEMNRYSNTMDGIANDFLHETTESYIHDTTKEQFFNLLHLPNDDEHNN